MTGVWGPREGVLVAGCRVWVPQGDKNSWLTEYTQRVTSRPDAMRGARLHQRATASADVYANDVWGSSRTWYRIPIAINDPEVAPGTHPLQHKSFH